MASVIPIRPKGPKACSYAIQFTAANGKRPKVLLGPVKRKCADEARRHIESLQFALSTGSSPDQQTAEWVRRLGPKVRDRLVRVGLLQPIPTVFLPDVGEGIGALADRYIEVREVELKPNTLRKLRQARKELDEHFGKKPLRAITAGDAIDFRQLLRKKFAEATVATHVKCAKQFFGYAKSHELIQKNPFGDVVAGSQSNESRLVFVDEATIEEVLRAVPDAQWRLIIALARYGGLRVPSEVAPLRWENIDLTQESFIVRVPKMERFPNRAARKVPMFLKLRPFFEAAAATAGTVGLVAPRAVRGDGEPEANLGTQFRRFINAAGVTPWERVFQNLRATRETELLAEGWPLHVVCSWIGNSPKVALKHYAMVTETAYKLAAAGLPPDRRVKSQEPFWTGRTEGAI